MKKFIFHVKQLKVKKFIKSISQLIPSISNATLEVASLRSCFFMEKPFSSFHETFFNSEILNCREKFIQVTLNFYYPFTVFQGLLPGFHWLFWKRIVFHSFMVFPGCIWTLLFFWCVVVTYIIVKRERGWKFSPNVSRSINSMILNFWSESHFHIRYH